MTLRRVTALALIAGSGIGIAACGGGNGAPYHGQLPHEIRALYPGATGIKYDDGGRSATGNVVWTLPDGEKCAGQYEYSYNVLAQRPFCVSLGRTSTNSTQAEIKHLYPGATGINVDNGDGSDTSNAIWRIPGGQICSAEASYSYNLIETQPVCFSGLG